METSQSGNLYIPEPTRCFRCQNYGHIAKNCNRRERCPICSEKHSYLACPIKDNHRELERARCPNCRGPHPASYKGCEKYKEAQKVVEIKTKEGISYADALKTLINNKGGKTEINEHTETRTGNIADLVIGQHPAAHSDTVHEKNSQESHACKKGNKVKDISCDQSNDHDTHDSHSHKQCVGIKTLVNFVQTIAIALKEDLTKEELIGKLFELIAEMDKTIHNNRRGTDSA